jgi:hypothetical protein
MAHIEAIRSYSFGQRYITLGDRNEMRTAPACEALFSGDDFPHYRCEMPQ